jgi:hypothetical protein
LRQLIGAPLPQAEQQKLDRTLLLAWKSLSEAQGQQAWEAGSAMTLEDSIRYSLEEPST